jgi:hypothetical protein
MPLQTSTAAPKISLIGGEWLSVVLSDCFAWSYTGKVTDCIPYSRILPFLIIRDWLFERKTLVTAYKDDPMTELWNSVIGGPYDMETHLIANSRKERPNIWYRTHVFQAEDILDQKVFRA